MKNVKKSIKIGGSDLELLVPIVGLLDRNL